MAGDYGPVSMPGPAWRGPEVRGALEKRDVPALLRAVQRHTGESQARLAAAARIGQPRMNEIFNGHRQITTLEVLERLAEGLQMPDDARILFGLAPLHLPVPKEITAVYDNPAEANAELRQQAAAAARIDVLTVRGLGLIAMRDSLLRGPLAARTTPAEVRVLLLDPVSPAAGARAAEVGESPESFTAGSRLALARLAEFRDHPYVTVRTAMYTVLPAWRMAAFDGVVYLSAVGPGRQGAMYRLAAAAGSVFHAGMSRQFEDMWAASTGHGTR